MPELYFCSARGTFCDLRSPNNSKRLQKFRRNDPPSHNEHSATKIPPHPRVEEIFVATRVGTKGFRVAFVDGVPRQLGQQSG
jgi:hypothetical protein